MAEDLSSLLSLLRRPALELALRLNDFLSYLEKHRGFAILRIEVKNGKAGTIHVEQSFKEGDELLPE